jgi:tRNA/rRNA methyltransferase
MGLAEIKIVLVEPAGALNVGSIARVMKNMGLSQLVVVNPQCDIHGEESRQMAVHAQEVLTQAKIVPDLVTGLGGCERAIATTARTRSLTTKLEPPREVLPWLLSTDQPTALIFGREDRGLSNEELDYAGRYLKIPVNPAYSSLNLASAVGICLYELHLLATEIPSYTVVENLATIDQLSIYYDRLEKLLLDIGYLYPHTAVKRMEKLKRLYNRSQLSQNELALLQGIIQQVNWYISKGNGQEK